MGPVHLYLAAWVAGGVLLGGSMLLDGREPAAEDNPFADPRAFGERGTASTDGLSLPAVAQGAQGAQAGSVPSDARLRRLRALARHRNLLPLGLIGFGLSGLTAKGLDLDHWPWSFLGALAIGLGMVGLGYRLSRPRPR